MCIKQSENPFVNRVGRLRGLPLEIYVVASEVVAWLAPIVKLGLIH